MLEQAVYAGRNHALSLAVAAIALLGSATPARAQAVARVPLGQAVRSLVVGTEGGAWVSIARERDFAIARLGPGATTTTVNQPLSDDAALGPDEAAWFGTSNDDVLLRADSAGAVTRLDLGGGISSAFAAGADGTLWVAGVEADTVAHVTARGVLARTPFAPGGCEHRPRVHDMTRASDGAMWLADSGCQRLLRLAGDMPQSFALRADEVPARLAADSTGGAWFTDDVRPVIGHVGAAGAIARVPYDLRRGPATDIATAPDGTAWFALDHCVLGHVAGASVTFLPAPIRVHSLGFDPSGALWLASAARVLRTTPAALSGAGCDETPPRVRIRPATGGTIRLAALREGVRITVPEPAQLSLTAGYGRRAPHRVQTRKRSLTFRVPRAWLSRIERGVAVGQRPRLTLFVDAVDREGNAVTVGGEVRVRR